MIDEREVLSGVNTEQLRFALDHVQAYVYMKDANSRYLYANKKTLALFGCSEEALIGQSDEAFFPPETIKKLRALDLKVLQGQPTQEEIVVERANGKKEYYWEHKSPIYSDSNPNEVVGVLGISTDITHQKNLESRLIEAATKDPLTGLPNRRQFLDRLHNAQQRSQRSGAHCAVIFLDLDGFKQLNDHHGHNVGDEYLVEVAQRISREVRDSDCVARIGGDEFVILLESLSHHYNHAFGSVNRVVRKITQALEGGFPDVESQYSLSASAGYTLFSGWQHSAEEILAEADKHMYEEKRKRAAARLSA